ELPVHLDAGGARDRRGRVLVHAERGTGRRGPGVCDAAQVERGLQRAVLAGTAVTAIHDDTDLDALALARVLDEPALDASLQQHRIRLRRLALDEVARLEPRRHYEPVAGLGPVQPDHVVPGVVQDARNLQAGQDADVVFRRRAAETDADLV